MWDLSLRAHVLDHRVPTSFPGRAATQPVQRLVMLGLWPGGEILASQTT